MLILWREKLDVAYYLNLVLIYLNVMNIRCSQIYIFHEAPQFHRDQDTQALFQLATNRLIINQGKHDRPSLARTLRRLSATAGFSTIPFARERDDKFSPGERL